MSDTPSVLQVTDIWERVHKLRDSGKFKGNPLAQAYLQGVEQTLDWILHNCPDGELIGGAEHHPIREMEKGKFELVLVMMYREEAEKEHRL